MKPKLIIRLGVAAVGIFVLAYGASPLLAARGLIQAAKAGDAAALERHVDFPAFRASLKDELSHRMVSELRGKSGRDSGLEALGMMLASSLVSGAVDTLVTPDTIATMVREGQAPSPKSVVTVEQQGQKSDSRVRQSWSYRDLDTFAVSLTRDDKPDERVALLMKRHNLFFWKLSGVDLSRPE